MSSNRSFSWSLGLNLLLATATGVLLFEHFHHSSGARDSAISSVDSTEPFTPKRVIGTNASPVKSIEVPRQSQDSFSTRVVDLAPVGAGITQRGETISSSSRETYAAQVGETSPVSTSIQPAQNTAISSSAPIGSATGTSVSRQSTAGFSAGVVTAGTIGIAPYTLNSHAGAPTYPVVLADPDPSISLTKQQAGVWQQLQQNFSDAVGGPNQNPSDPSYAASWSQAKDTSDQMFRAKFGFQAWLQQSTAASRQGRNP